MGLGAFSLSLSPRALAAAQLQATDPHRLPLVVLDPGHGGVDPGCIGATGTYEKFIAFATASEIGRQLEASGRYKVIMTRSVDEFIPLRDRVAFARDAGGDLFLSIHADAIPDDSVRGASVFTLSEKASDATAAALAARENKADLVGGIDLGTQSPEVSNILLDLTRRRTNNLSIGFAKQLVSKLAHETRMLEHSHRAAGFAVLKAPDIPSALVEIGCLSNREDEKLLRTAAYRSHITAGIVQSIDAYYSHVVRT